MITTEQLQLFALQFITQGDTAADHLRSARAALEGGCRWIQLRMKDAEANEVEDVAREMLSICKQFGAVCIIDDHVEVCRKVNADGVHLGKNDMAPDVARKMLKDNQIIGGTCNTFEDIKAVSEHVDYIGCGPFRYTTTKKNLAPLLGLDGYREIVWKCRSEGINTPIVAIGGITLADIRDVLEAGPNGIALSGTIATATDPVQTTKNLVEVIEQITRSKI